MKLYRKKMFINKIIYLISTKIHNIMKKTITLFILLFSLITINAATYYVDATKTDDSGDGFSWSTAKQTIDAAQTLAVSGDNIYVKTGTYNYSASVSGTYALSTKANVNYYGGFSGTELNISERAISDLDGNGIVESFELTNPTTINFTLTNNAGGLNITANTTTFKSFDGFSITGTNTCGDVISTTIMTPIINLGGSTTTTVSTFVLFQNNTVSGLTITGNLNGTGGCVGAILRMPNGGASTVNSCLFDNNSVSLSGGANQTDVQVSPFIRIDNPSGANRNLFSNNMIRRNMVTVDFTSCSIVTGYFFSTGNAGINSNTRGFIISESFTTSTAWNSVRNNVIYNNEANYTAPTGSTFSNKTLSGAGLIYSYNTASAVQDSIVNNTIANNKMIRCGSALKIRMANATQPYHKVLNNICFQNKNVDASAVVTDLNIVIQGTVPDNTTPGVFIANNICSGGGITNATAAVANNLNDLSLTNTDATKGAWFNSPSSTYGASATGILTSRWAIGTSSYLIGKGVATLNLRDRNGIAFALTPSVGAYEYVSSGTTEINKVAYNNNNNTLVQVEGRKLIFVTPEQAEIYSSLGRLIATKNNVSSLTVNNSGVYIIKQYCKDGIKVQKIIVRN